MLGFTRMQGLIGNGTSAASDLTPCTDDAHITSLYRRRNPPPDMSIGHSPPEEGAGLRTARRPAIVP